MGKEKSLLGLLGELGEVSGSEKVKEGLRCLEELDLEGAAKLLKEAVDSDLGSAYCGFGMYLLEKKRPEKAEAVFMKAVKLKSGDAYLGLSLSYFFQEDMLEEAESAFEVSLGLIPADKNYGSYMAVMVYTSIARKYQNQNKHEKAEALFSKAADAMEQIPESKRGCLADFLK